MGLGKRSETSSGLARDGARGAARLRTIAASGASVPPDERERGSIILLFALFITLFALLCAVVVDVGYWWVTGKKAQVAADACALAAASQLPADWDSPPLDHCRVAGTLDYAKTNLPLEGLANEPRHTGTVVTSPYVSAKPGDPNTYVEAEVSMVVRTFFGRVIGLDYVTLSRRAVAEQSEGGPGTYAIYSHTSDCPNGLQFNDNNHSINGRVHSNGEFLVNNGGATPFWAKEGTAVTCTNLPAGQVRFGGTGWTANGDPTPDIVGTQTWPEYFTPAQFGWSTCGGATTVQKIEISGTELKIDGQPKPFPVVGGRRVIPSGIYCATEVFTLSGNNIDGDITVLSPKIEISGNDNHFTPFAGNGVLFFQVPNTNLDQSDDGEQDGVPEPNCANATEELKIEGNNGKWEGRIFHPCGRVLVNGDGWTSVGGAIYAKRVKIDGNDFNMIGNGGGGNAAKTVSLVE